MTDIKSFDIASFLSGGSYPTKDIPISFDGPALQELSEIEKRLVTPGLTPEEAEAVEERRVGVIERLKDSTFTVRVKGTPTKVRKDLVTKATHEFPDVEGVAPDARDEYYTGLLWEAHIVEIIAPDGSSTRPTPENIASLRETAPDYVHLAISSGIAELTNETQLGYYTLVTSADFLSKP